MRKLLLLALLLYDIVEGNRLDNSVEADYEEIEKKKGSSGEGKRHSFTEDRRSWRRKSLTKADDEDDKNSNSYYGHRTDDPPERVFPLKNRKRSYDIGVESEVYLDDKDVNKRNAKTSPLKKEVDKKSTLAMNCNREHERYEPCFAGCASVSCDNPRDRLRACYPFCEPGCVCVPPRVRDDRTHKCVMPDECTKGLKGIPDLGAESPRTR